MILPPILIATDNHLNARTYAIMEVLCLQVYRAFEMTSPHLTCGYTKVILPALTFSSICPQRTSFAIPFTRGVLLARGLATYLVLAQAKVMPGRTVII